MMKILLPYQQKWIDDKSRFKIGMFARQTGKTFTTTFEIAKDCVEHDVQGKATRWVILSRGERQAREAMDEGVKRHIAALQASFTARDYDYAGGDGIRYRALEIAFPSGSRITALPANPDTARGFSANVLLDEFAFHADSRAIWKALFPVISRGWCLRVVSTPNGKGNKFFELMSGADEWSRHTVNIYQAVEQGLMRDVEQLRRAMGDDDGWRQEFELEWMDYQGSWLPFDLILGCEDRDAGRPDAYRGGPCYIGVDIARRHDLWVAWVCELVGDVLWTREIRTLKGETFAAQDAALDQLMTRYRVVRVAMDQTGMGEKPVEDAQARYGAHIVEGVILTGPRRLTVATAARQAFEDRRLRLPPDPVVRADLHKIKKVQSATGGLRLIADRDSAGHADRAWACMLCLAAASVGAVPIEHGCAPVRASAGAFGDDHGGDDHVTLGYHGWMG